MNLRGTLLTFFYMLKFTFSVPVITIRFWYRRRKAVGLFKKELIAQGLSKKEANELADVYPFKLGDVIGLARSLSSS